MQRTERLSEECRLTAMGLRLRHAREALQISESSAAEQLFLSVGQVRALEDARAASGLSTITPNITLFLRQAKGGI